MTRYLDRIIARFKSQRKKGIDKYGQVLENNHAPMLERIEHLAQELTDGLMYIEWMKERATFTKDTPIIDVYEAIAYILDSAQVETDGTSFVRRNPDRTIRERLSFEWAKANMKARDIR